MTTEVAQVKSDIDVVIEEPKPKQPRHELTTAVAEIDYEVLMLGGTCLQVKVAADGRARDLYHRIRESGSVPSALFSIVSSGDRILEESELLPAAGTALKLVVENPERLCEAAQRIIRESPATVQGKGDPALLQRLRLGRCCELGTFEQGQWTNHEDEPSDVDDEPWYQHIEEGSGRYHVCELELIDGEDRHKKLVAVISEGSMRDEIPAFGPVYLRPDFKRVARLYGDDEIASSWVGLEDSSSWYTDPVVPLPRSICISTGGREAKTPLETHLAHALAVAVSGNSLCLGAIKYDDGDDGWYSLWDGE